MRTGPVGLVWVVAFLCAGVFASAAADRVYAIVPSESALTIHVGKTGLLKGFGHEHDVVARRLVGQVEIAPDLRRSRVSLTVDSASLEVQARGEPRGDTPKVQETMLGPKVLDVAHHAAIKFQSTAINVKQAGDETFDVEISGVLELRGVARAIKFPTRVELAGDQLRARGTATLRQSDFGIEPVRAAAGGVQVKNEVELQFVFVARPNPQP
jgi:polyisoprenoid-binding protein YceI